MKARAGELRKHSTIAEILLWNQLKRGQRLGCDFHRQRPISHWIADFFCAELMLVVEVDGDSHRFRAANDERKDSALTALGIAILRFGDSQVRNDMNGVVKEIDAWIAANRESRKQRVL